LTGTKKSSAIRNEPVLRQLERSPHIRDPPHCKLFAHSIYIEATQWIDGTDPLTVIPGIDSRGTPNARKALRSCLIKFREVLLQESVGLFVRAAHHSSSESVAVYGTRVARAF